MSTPFVNLGMTTLETLDIQPIQLVAVRSAHLSVQHKHNYYKIDNTFLCHFLLQKCFPGNESCFRKKRVVGFGVFPKNGKRTLVLGDGGANNVALEFLDE
jgi:hypothetical protein